MNEVREEAVGWLWVVVGGSLTFLLPAWVLLTAMTIQLSPELSGVDLLLEGLAEQPNSQPFLTVWIAGGWKAAKGLMVVAPVLGLVVTAAALLRRGEAARVQRFHVALDDEMKDAAVLQGVKLVGHTETTGGTDVQGAAAAVEAPVEVRLASPVHRLGAVGIDGALVFGVYLGPILVVTPFVDLQADSPSLVLLVGAGVALVGMIVLAAVQLRGLAVRGQTLGKQWLGLRIVRPDGSPAGAGAVLGVRTLAYGLLLQLPVIGWFVLPLIDLVLLLADERHRTLHDRLADTVVVEVGGH